MSNYSFNLYHYKTTPFLISDGFEKSDLQLLNGDLVQTFKKQDGFFNYTLEVTGSYENVLDGADKDFMSRLFGRSSKKEFVPSKYLFNVKTFYVPIENKSETIRAFEMKRIATPKLAHLQYMVDEDAFVISEPCFFIRQIFNEIIDEIYLQYHKDHYCFVDNDFKYISYGE